MMDSMLNQLMLEKMQMLEEALERAEAGTASGDDWNIIRSECGVSMRPIVTLQTVSIRSGISWV